MASSKDYLEYILDQLSGLYDVSCRAMMGEYIIYYRGKIVGGIYDDRFLVKPVKAAVAMMPDADLELPYEGAKEMLLTTDRGGGELLLCLDVDCDPGLEVYCEVILEDSGLGDVPWNHRLVHDNVA